MQTTQIIVLETDGRLSDRLRSLAEQQKVWLRTIHQFGSATKVLRRPVSGVMVIRVGRDLDREFGILQHAAHWSSQLATIVVGDTDHPTLTALAWDFGASYVLFPPQPLDVLPDVVEGLIKRHE